MRASVGLSAALLLATACSGSINCGGCVPGGLDPIPGGFPDQAQLDRAVELRMSQSGLDFLGTSFGDLATAFASMACGPMEPVACPTNFVINGQRTATSCGVDEICVGPGGASEPVLGFEVEQATQSGATVCRDDLLDPARRACFAWLRLEGLALRPVAPDRLEADVRAQIYTSVIPIRYDALGMDCVVTLDSNASGASQQEFNVVARVGPWVPPMGAPGGQLDISITDVSAMIPDQDISIIRDPVHGDFGDSITCGIANLGAIKTALVGRLVGSLADIIDEEIANVLAQRCGRAGDPMCPVGTSCNSDGRCQVDGSDEIVPQRLGLEGRIDLAGILPGFGNPSGAMDVAGLVGGTAGADADGLSIGLRAGVELAAGDPTCGIMASNPRTRPGYTPPVALPSDRRVDLDFDGAAERTYMLAAGVSQQILDQLIWSAASTGLFCASISSDDTELLNTGSLAVLMPSLNQLTHADRYAWSIWPARIAIRPTAEPRLIIGEGKTSGTSPNITLETPLLTLRIPGLELSFSAVIEERWVHLMRVKADVDIPLGIFAEPGGNIRLLVGDLANSITNVEVSDHDILAETKEELEMSVPALISLVLPQLTDALAVPLSLPSGRDLGGFEPTLLGARGVPAQAGTFSHLGVYLDLDFDPSLAPPLRAAVDTTASLTRWDVPSSAEMSVANVGGPRLPVVEIALGHRAPAGARVETQVRIDGGAWSPFVERTELVLTRPELLLQGVHRVELRAREVMNPRSLDPTPAVIELVTDTVAPKLEASLTKERDAVVFRSYDVVSRDDVTVRVSIDGVAFDVSGDEDGVVELGEAARDGAEIVIEAEDRSGNVSRRVLARGRVVAAEATGDTSTGGCSSAPTASSWLILLAALGVMRRRVR